jgi:hypothetical protein
VFTRRTAAVRAAASACLRPGKGGRAVAEDMGEVRMSIHSTTVIWYNMTRLRWERIKRAAVARLRLAEPYVQNTFYIYREHILYRKGLLHVCGLPGPR